MKKFKCGYYHPEIVKSLKKIKYLRGQARIRQRYQGNCLSKQMAEERETKQKTTQSTLISESSVSPIKAREQRYQ